MKTIITSEDRSGINLTEMRRYYGLFKYLSLRDVFIRYKQTWIGFGWSVIRPLINILIFGSLSFLIDPTQNFSEKFLMVSAGIVFWQLISSATTDVSNSLSGNANILSKVYFPKLLLPFSSLLVCLIDFLISFALFLVFYLVLKGLPPWQIVFLPLVILYGLVFALGLGLLFATGSVKYRDVKFLLPFLLQILFYASPVFISSEFILSKDLPEAFKIIYQLNPLLFIINGFKFCFTGHFESFNMMYAGVGFAVTIVLLIIAVRYFFSFEKSFADYI